MARARDILGEKRTIVAVIGDGAMTGGLAYEGLNDASRLNSNLIIILNDNKMSISPNVGGMSSYLSEIRTSDGYIQLRKGQDPRFAKRHCSGRCKGDQPREAVAQIADGSRNVL